MSSTSTNRLAALVTMLAFARGWLESAVDVQRPRGKSKADSLFPGADDSRVQRAANAGTVVSVVVIGVVAMVGILIFAQVEEAMPTVDGPLNDTLTSITTGFGNALEFVPIVMLVLLASVVIAIVQRMRG